MAPAPYQSSDRQVPPDAQAPSDPRHRLGARGERYVARRLRAAGWQIRERNWRCRFGEIDIVALDDDVLVLVEVRTRSSRRYGSPGASLVWHKRMRMARLAQAYVAEAGWRGPWRIDAVTVEVRRARRSAPWRVVRYQHLRNALA